MPIPFLPNVKKIAIVGVSRNPEKWGYKVFKTLREKFPDVVLYPINPKATKIDGVRAYNSLDDLPEIPDLVVTVVPPEVTKEVVDKAIKMGIKMIWMQPGSESNEAIRKAIESGVKVFHNVCIVESSRLGKIAFKFER